MSDDWMNRLYDGDVLYGNGDDDGTTATLVDPAREDDFPAGGDDTPSGGERSHAGTKTSDPLGDESDTERTPEDQPEMSGEPTVRLPREATDADGDESTDTPEEEKSGKLTGLRQRAEALKARTAKAKASAVKAKAGAGKKTGRIAKRVRPARDAVAASVTNKRWGFLWAAGASWLIGPQTLVAAWDRIVLIFGMERYASGEEPMGWGLLHGPGRWFRDQVAANEENGTMLHLLACAAFGVVPLLVLAAHREWPQYGKWLLGLLVGAPALYLIGVSYWGWPLTWTDIYVAGLFASAWYCTVWAKSKDEGIFRFLLMIPLASVVSGALLYSPGAAF